MKTKSRVAIGAMRQMYKNVGNERRRRHSFWEFYKPEWQDSAEETPVVRRAPTACKTESSSR